MILAKLFLLNFIIEILLVLTSNRMCGFPAAWKRAAIAAVVSSIYATACIFTIHSELARPLFRFGVLVISAGIAYGISYNAISRFIVYIILSTALGRMTIGDSREGTLPILISVISLSAVCLFALRDKVFCRKIIPVEIIYKDKSVKLNALWDTGNELKDPISGKSVLVVDREICKMLIGFSCEQLRNPVETLQKSNIPGLRLIPFKTIGRSDGMLLGLYYPVVKIGDKVGGGLVAFAPEKFSGDGAYQALIGDFV